jgi:hypothetical protein
MQMEGADRLLALVRAAESGGALQDITYALSEVSSEVLAESLKLVPVDTGTLKGSGMVHRPEVSGSQVTAKVSYGGAASQYAAVVHEDMTANHPHGGQAKYLATVVERYAAGPFVDKVARRFLMRLRGRAS